MIICFYILHKSTAAHIYLKVAVPTGRKNVVKNDEKKMYYLTFPIKRIKM